MSSSVSCTVTRHPGGIWCDDVVAVESAVEIRVAFGPRPGRRVFSLGVTLRTPGDDADLVAGLILGDGLIRSADDLDGVAPCGPGDAVVRAELAPAVAIDPDRFRRLAVASAACGACGKPTLGGLAVPPAFPVTPGRPRLSPEQVCRLPDALRRSQPTFDTTGGLHAAGLLTPGGEGLFAREDVGRHNAVDKAVGAALRADRLPLPDAVLVVTGRAGYELVQKAAVAGVGVLVAVGAPSSAAVGLATAAGVTLVGFARDDRCNVYSHAGRVCGHG